MCLTFLIYLQSNPTDAVKKSLWRNNGASRYLSLYWRVLNLFPGVPTRNTIQYNNFKVTVITLEMVIISVVSNNQTDNCLSYVSATMRCDTYDQVSSDGQCPWLKSVGAV